MKTDINVEAKEYVADEEKLCRLISSPLGYNKVTGVSPDSFRLFRKNESYISVERLLLVSFDDMIVVGENIQKWFTEGESFWGAAILTAGNVRKNPKLDVVSKYTKSHPSHAGIEIRLENGLLYKSKPDIPTPHEVLLLQLYLSTIVECVNDKEGNFVTLP